MITPELPFIYAYGCSTWLISCSLKVNGVVDVVVMPVHALFKDIRVVLEDALKTCPLFMVTIAMVYVTTARKDIYKLHWVDDSVLMVRTVLTYSKITLCKAYSLLILISAGVLQKLGIEPIHGQALCCSCRYMSWIMMIFLCANVRLRVEREQHDSVIEESRRIELNANRGMIEEHSEYDSDGDSDEQLEEDLTRIEYDGYLCFKKVNLE